MSIIKSFSVGDGDMFYIKHNSDNFSIIDCFLADDKKEIITNEILNKSKNKEVTRFISTHPDEDHIYGLQYLDQEKSILNFYCVKNEATKEEETVDFKKYCELRDSSKAFYIEKDCSRRWMNQSNEERGSSGIFILWPDRENEYFQEELEKIEDGENPNNISPIIKYSLEGGVTTIWMGDLEKSFMEKIKDEIQLPEIDLLFVPHHGRKTGKIPLEMLENLNPKLIIVGEAPSKDLEYYQDYNKITQNSAGDIIFECVTDKIHIYVYNENYEVDFLDNENMSNFDNYIGTLQL